MAGTNPALTPAVLGESDNGYGVWGDSFDGYGVFGRSNNGPGAVGARGFGPVLVVRSTAPVLVEGYASCFGSQRVSPITSSGTYVSGSDFAEAMPARGGNADYEPGD